MDSYVSSHLEEHPFSIASYLPICILLSSYSVRITIERSIENRIVLFSLVRLREIVRREVNAFPVIR